MSAPSQPVTTIWIWHDIKIMVTHKPNYIGDMDHIELHVENKQRIPVTETGYRSHWMHSDQLEPYGTAVKFVEAWLDSEAQSPEWQAYELASKQLSLF